MSDEPEDGWTAAAREWREERDKIIPLKGRRRKLKPGFSPPAERPTWFAALRRSESGGVIVELANVMIALRGEPSIAAGVAFDEMRQRPIATRVWPHAPDARPIAGLPREITEHDVTCLQEWLQLAAIPRVSHEMVEQGLEALAREHPFHPIRDWLESLEHDGVPRIGQWLHVCLGVPDDEYHRQIGSMFLIAMAARIFEPGCQCDYMLVLEGPQGEEKSKFCRALAGGEAYFSEHLPRIDGDQVRLSMHLRGNWLIEVAELAAMLKSDPEGVKQFISRRTEKYTPKYGHGEVTEHRQCLFVGTTNEDEYIRDVTGGRRYWPIAVQFVDVGALGVIRDQLFAEAVSAYRHGKPWWPNRDFEKAVITPVQDERQFEDALTERVLDIIETLQSITLAQLGTQLGFDSIKFDMASQKRVSNVLRKLKWRKVRITDGRKMWIKPEQNDP